MSTVPIRRPVPTRSQAHFQTLSRNGEVTEKFRRPLLDAIPSQDQNLASAEGAGSIPPSTDGYVLVLSKANVEQLALLLLDLVGSTPQDGSAVSVDPDTGRHRLNPLVPAEVSPYEKSSKPSPVVSQEILRPAGQDLGQSSQILLERQPWLHEKVIVEVPMTGATTDEDGRHMDEDNKANVSDEGISLTARRRPLHLLPSSRLSENSLYLLQENHAWTDLQTHLGPGKFTDEGRTYWLTARRPRGWPAVIPFEKRLDYLTDLWTVLSLHAPAPQEKHTIVSDLDKNNQLSRAYKQAIARNLPRHSNFGRQKPWRSRKSLLSKISSRLQGFSQALFSTADSARGRLPSTAYLRIIGQSLFENALPESNEGSAETSVRILIATLDILGTKSSSEDINPTEANAGDTSSKPPGRMSGEVTVWDLLVACYRKDILRQPDQDADGLPTVEKPLWDHIDKVFDALQLVNLFTRLLDKSFLRSIPLEELLSSRIESICSRATLRRRESLYPAGGSEYFGKKGFNIKTLQDIGALNIFWTIYIDEHLSLDTHFGELRVFWPGWALANLPCASLFSPGSNSTVLQDLLATYKFLFYSPSGFDAAISEYKKLDAPSWLSSMNTPLSVLTKGRTLIGDIRYHFGSYEYAAGPSQFASENTAMMRFDACGMFENRVRILKAYMDSQRPSGLLALWRDKRDSGQWYTFWLVLILGGISLFLALASLAVIIAQTVAGFEAIHYQIGGGASDSSNSTAGRKNSTAQRRDIFEAAFVGAVDVTKSY